MENTNATQMEKSDSTEELLDTFAIELSKLSPGDLKKKLKIIPKDVLKQVLEHWPHNQPKQ